MCRAAGRVGDELSSSGTGSARSASAHGAQRDHDDDFADLPLYLPHRHTGPGRNVAVGSDVLPRRDDETSRAAPISRPVPYLIKTIRLIFHRGDVCENTATEAGPGLPRDLVADIASE